MSNYKLLDLFCGAGGLSLGFEKNNFEVVKAIDFAKYAIETYNYNREDKVAIVKDITEIDEEYLKDIGEIDGIIGGPPCQGFSTAGQRIIDDERNVLYREYFKILTWVKPKFFLIENVTGILNFAGGLVKEDILKRSEAIGYKVFYETLNSVNFGIPQNRKRVFFVGFREDVVGKDFSFPVGDDNLISIADAISDLPSLDKNEDNSKYSMEPKTEYQKYIRNNTKVLANHEQSAHKEDTKKTIELVPEGGSLRDIPEELRGGRNYNALLRKMDRSKPSYTIDTGHRTYFHYEERRVPSVRESARLQSFFDDYVFVGPKAEQYKQVGNAVPPVLSERLAGCIQSYLDNNKGGELGE